MLNLVRKLSNNCIEKIIWCKSILKEQRIVENSNTKYIGFLSRFINFLEDVLDDAWCEDIFVDKSIYDSRPIIPGTIEVEPYRCSYEPEESIRVFSGQWDIDIDITIGKGYYSLNELYFLIPSIYVETLHYLMKSYASKTIANKREYFLAILFNGKGFLVEGEVNRVRIPFVPHCLSSHTHPSHMPVPSKGDIEMILYMMLNRGFLHVIETVGASLYIYRVRPLSEDDLVKLRSIESLNNYRDVISVFKSIESVRLEYR